MIINQKFFGEEDKYNASGEKMVYVKFKYVRKDILRIPFLRFAHFMYDLRNTQYLHKPYVIFTYKKDLLKSGFMYNIHNIPYLSLSLSLPPLRTYVNFTHQNGI